MDATSKKKEVPSRKEAAAEPQAAATGAKKRPVKVIQVEDISVPIFAYEREQRQVRYSWTVSRSYKDSTGQVRRTSWFGLDDCGKVVTAIQQAAEWMHEQTAEPKAQ